MGDSVDHWTKSFSLHAPATLVQLLKSQRCKSKKSVVFLLKAVAHGAMWPTTLMMEMQ